MSLPRQESRRAKHIEYPDPTVDSGVGVQSFTRLFSAWMSLTPSGALCFVFLSFISSDICIHCGLYDFQRNHVSLAQGIFRSSRRGVECKMVAFSSRSLEIKSTDEDILRCGGICVNGGKQGVSSGSEGKPNHFIVQRAHGINANSAK